MSERPSQLLACPNPWCEGSDPCLRSGSARLGGAERHWVACARCRMDGPAESSPEAAVAAWNTRAGSEGEDCGWYDANQTPPEGEPVVALYRAWNRPDGKLMKHVVWWREGGWRIYPFTANRGYVDRWRPLAV